MIEINLLPGARKKSPSRAASVDVSAAFAGVFGRLKDKVLIGTVAGCVLSAAAVGWMYVSQDQAQQQLDVDLKKAHADSVRYSTLFRENTRITASRDTLLRQLNLIKTIDQDRYIWPHVLDEVSRALPQYTWITSLVITGTPQGQAAVVSLPPTPKDTSTVKKPTKPKRIDTSIPADPVTFRIFGNTVDIEALPRFMRDLEASPFLANVTLDLSAHGVEQGQDITKFQLTLTYTRPDTAQLKRVPLVMRMK
jgi:Tfp pilus assembly protein PilN